MSESLRSLRGNERMSDSLGNQMSEFPALQYILTFLIFYNSDFGVACVWREERAGSVHCTVDKDSVYSIFATMKKGQHKHACSFNKLFRDFYILYKCYMYIFYKIIHRSPVHPRCFYSCCETSHHIFLSMYSHLLCI